MNDGVLTLRGEKKSVTEDTTRHLSERFYGRFERQIPLPSEVREDRVTASFKNGVLSVSLPKSSESTQKRRRIAIKG